MAGISVVQAKPVICDQLITLVQARTYTETGIRSPVELVSLRQMPMMVMLSFRTKIDIVAHMSTI